MSDLLQMFEETYGQYKYKVRVDSDRRALRWQDSGLCAQTDPDLFYPEQGDIAEKAKSLCKGCPVQLQCAQYAIDNGEEYGIWGGLSPATITRLRRRGRARISQAQLDRLLRRDEEKKAEGLAKRRQW